MNTGSTPTAVDASATPSNCPTHGPLAAADIVHGYEYGAGQHVLVESDELDRSRPNQDRV